MQGRTLAGVALGQDFWLKTNLLQKQSIIYPQ